MPSSLPHTSSRNMDPTYPVYPIVSFLCFFLVLSPLPWQFRAWNTGTCMYILWTATGCLIWFINSLVWHNNAIDWAPVYCDICPFLTSYSYPTLIFFESSATRIVTGTAVAIPACSLCIQRRLYCMTSTCVVTTSKREKIKDVCIDLAICLGFPLFIMALGSSSVIHLHITTPSDQGSSLYCPRAPLRHLRRHRMHMSYL